MADDEDEPVAPGEEEEIQQEEEPVHEEVVEEEEAESLLTVYDPDEFISGAVNSLDSTIPLDLLEFEYSYGYNCHKYFNLCACDETVVCWAAGSIVTFLDVETKQTWFRRSTTGGTVGAVSSYRKDPNYRIAIAEARENERDPLILLYTWPQMEIDAVLRDGTTNAYSVLDFSPDGDLLASVGKEPDYNLTIWNWKRHSILLRTSAFTFDVNGVMFSPYCPGQLTTAGAAHIKFWKMAETFTGLKLKGELGRFGKTEICDVLGVYPMPDEKVLSGCEWGNVLVWEAGLVKLEVTQRGRKTCHAAPVIQFMLSPAGDEVTTVARDGCVRAWYWDTVEQADPPEDDPYVELNPVAETCVPGCQIMCLKHQKDMFWYAQDGNGGVWVTELEIDKIECNHRKVMTCHAGGIVAMAALRTHPILITAGEDGALMAYSTKSHVILAKYTFPTAITCMLYPPIDVDETSRILMVGFKDGVMRTLLLHPERLISQRSMLDIRVHSNLTIHSEDSLNPDVIDLISLLKPHSKSITQISINDERTLLVTCGEDTTIFMYQLNRGTPFTLERLGFIVTPNNVAYMTWKPGEERVLLLCGQVGFIMEAVLPDIEVRVYSEITTFKLDFVSYKEILLKKHYMRNRPFPEEEDLASIDEEALKAQGEAAGKDDEEEEMWLGEIELMESESMLGTTITWAQYCDDGIWVVQKGTGCLFLVTPGSNKVIKYAPLPGAWCDELTVLYFVCEGQYLIVGTHNGYIRMVKMPNEEADNPDYHYVTWKLAMQNLLKKLKGRRLAKEEKQPTPRLDFLDTYYLPMHDRYTGAITCLAFSSDGKRLFSCGQDGNIFSYDINFDQPLLPVEELPEIKKLPKVDLAQEVSTVEGEMMSHEQLKQKEEFDKMMAIANAHKKRVRDQLAEITSEYNKIIKANRLLPVSQQIDVTIDPRPLVVQESELNEAKALTVRKLAHQLEASDLALHKMYHRNIIQVDVFPFTLKAIREPNVTIRPLRQKNLSKVFRAQLEEVYAKMAEAALRGRRTESTARKVAARRASWGPPRVASFLLGLPPRPPHPLKKALRNYYTRLHRHHLQFIEWQEHLSRKPDPNAMPPGAADALRDAEASIGNRLLKTHPDYVAPPGHNTQLRVCLIRKEIYDNKRTFNAKLLELREHKLKLVDLMKTIGQRLSEIRLEIPPKLAKAPPPIPVIDEDLEFPEKNLEIKPEPITKLMASGRGGTGKKSVLPDRKATTIYPQRRHKQPKVPRFVPLAESHPLVATWDRLKARPDIVNTPMEIEIRERRIGRHLYQQDILLGEATDAIQKFDSRLLQLQRDRIRVQEKNQLLELHLYQLHREMNVLNKFEAHEDRLAERVYSKLMQVRGVQDLIQDCEHRIEEHRGHKDSLGVDCEEIQRQFKKLVQDNKFADFLRRIFKKKYRAPRVHDDDESSESEESSSSSEEEDEGSLDSRDIGPIRLDPNICPEGCDKEVYDKTFELRNLRHRHEQDMIEQDRLVELLRKDIDAHNKIKRKLSVQLEKRKNELREFMLEKQSRMNDVDEVVVLRYDQLRASAVRGCTGPQGLANAVVFPEQLLTRLRNRVLELQDEIKQQTMRMKINRKHLFRMNIDLRAMEARAEELRVRMCAVLTRKLGKPRKYNIIVFRISRVHLFRMNIDLRAMEARAEELRVRMRAVHTRKLGKPRKYNIIVFRINRTHLFRMNIDLRAMEARAEELRVRMRAVHTRKLGKPRKYNIIVFRINRTHLFRMNIDLRAMEARAEELRVRMRAVLTRKLGKPRKYNIIVFRINRTHLFRMNIDLRAMEARAEELRVRMRAVLTRKLGKPRKVDKTLDDLLRQMARRHKFSATLGAMPQIMTQLHAWRERHSTLEKKYLESLHNYSNRLRLAAALQADVQPQKAQKDPTVMQGSYLPEQYQRDVVRLRIVRQRQRQQIQALKEEITGLRLKPLSDRTPFSSAPISYVEDDRIYLSLAPRVARPKKTKYFPITPLGSQAKLVRDVNIMKLLFDCLDTMRVTRDDADALMQDLTTELADVIAGSRTRFEVIDTLLKKWLLKYGGDPSQYKKQTRAFDALAAVADRLIRQHTATMEGASAEAHQVMESLEEALKEVSDEKEPLHNRLGPALAALLATTSIADIESEEAMTSLVNSLLDKDSPLTLESINRVNKTHVIDDIKDCGISAKKEDIMRVIEMALECLRAQLVGSEEASQLEVEVEKAMSMTKMAHPKSDGEYTEQLRQSVARTTRFKSIQDFQKFDKPKSEHRSRQKDFYKAGESSDDVSGMDKSTDEASDEKSSEAVFKSIGSVSAEISAERLAVPKKPSKSSVIIVDDRSVRTSTLPVASAEISKSDPGILEEKTTSIVVEESKSAEIITKKCSTTVSSTMESQSIVDSADVEITTDGSSDEKPPEEKETEPES